MAQNKQEYQYQAFIKDNRYFIFLDKEKKELSFIYLTNKQANLDTQEAVSSQEKHEKNLYFLKFLSKECKKYEEITVKDSESNNVNHQEASYTISLDKLPAISQAAVEDFFYNHQVKCYGHRGQEVSKEEIINEVKSFFPTIMQSDNENIDNDEKENSENPIGATTENIESSSPALEKMRLFAVILGWSTFAAASSFMLMALAAPELPSVKPFLAFFDTINLPLPEFTSFNDFSVEGIASKFSLYLLTMVTGVAAIGLISSMYNLLKSFSHNPSGEQNIALKTIGQLSAADAPASQDKEEIEFLLTQTTSSPPILNQLKGMFQNFFPANNTKPQQDDVPKIPMSGETPNL